jgi:hypothetical protein
MRRILALVLAAALAVLVTAPALAAPATGITATPAATEPFDGGNCTATFVRSASGIINETNRVCAGSQNPWTSADVWLQFRPLTGPDGNGSPTPNPTCDPNGLVTSFTWSNSEASIGGTPTEGYFIESNSYNVCVYLVNPVVASGTVDSASSSGTMVSLPSGLSGHFLINVSGEWLNTPHGLVDAQYNNGDYGTTEPWPLVEEGWPGLGSCWGRLLVNGACIDWGAFNPAHAYSYTLSTSGSITLAVNDTYYPDNVGSLSYTITYLGQ